MLSDLIKEEEPLWREFMTKNWTWCDCASYLNRLCRWVTPESVPGSAFSKAGGPKEEGGDGKENPESVRTSRDPQNPCKSLIASKPPVTEQSDARSRGALVFTQQLMLVEAGLYLKHSNLGRAQSTSARSPSFPWDPALPMFPTRPQ